MKEITIEISDATYALLREAAHVRGAAVREIIGGAVMAVAREYQRPFAQLVADLHAKRKTTPEIAQALGVTNARVARQLSALRLPPNPIPKTIKPISPRSRKARQ